MQGADRQALVVFAATALLFAQSRADAAQRAGQRQPVSDDLYRAPVVVARAIS